ncbi:hypothetical protein J4Q44_G00089260 [Coregonus suidteri]|uniref:Uncharacterized protein n=1 Tax=Coregonus suidteri TaxID=861788 RepID=A0AAN8QYG7_9TELE
MKFAVVQFLDEKNEPYAVVLCLAVKGATDLKSTVWQMLPCILSNRLAITIWTGAGDKACFNDLFLKTILHRAIRKNPATRDATDEGVQIQVTQYLKGAFSCEDKDNYFLGSCVGGRRSALTPAAVSLSGPDDTTLLFEGRFESGDLLKATRVGEFDYELSLRTDLYKEKHTQGFHFQDTCYRSHCYLYTYSNLWAHPKLCEESKVLLYFDLHGHSHTMSSPTAVRTPGLLTDTLTNASFL